MNREAHRLVVILLVTLVTCTVQAQDAACDADVMRLRVFHLTGPLIDKSRETHDAVFAKLRQKIIGIRWNSETLKTQTHLEYLVGLELEPLPEELPRSFKGYARYFEGEKNARVLQTVHAVVKQNENDAEYYIEAYLNRRNCNAKPCYFRQEIRVPPPYNQDLIVDFYLVLILYALSIDAQINCTHEAAAALRQEAIRLIDENEANELEFDRMMEVRALIASMHADQEHLE